MEKLPRQASTSEHCQQAVGMVAHDKFNLAAVARKLSMPRAARFPRWLLLMAETASVEARESERAVESGGMSATYGVHW